MRIHQFVNASFYRRQNIENIWHNIANEFYQVENLEPPWGQCELRELMYYNKYSMDTCSLDCLNEEVRTTCQCKDIYMPEPLNGTKGTC